MTKFFYTILILSFFGFALFGSDVSVLAQSAGYGSGNTIRTGGAGSPLLYNLGIGIILVLVFVAVIIAFDKDKNDGQE